MTDANERMAPFGDDAHEDGEGEIAPRIPGGTEEKRRHGEVKDARDLDLTDVQLFVLDFFSVFNASSR